MPLTCSVCRHPNLADIDIAILRFESLRDIARQFGLSKDAVARHKADHLPKTLVKAQAAQELMRADNLLAHVQHREAGLEQLDEDTRQIQETAMAENDRDGALDAIKVRTVIARERRAYLELFGQLSDELAHADLSATRVQVILLPRLPGVDSPSDTPAAPAALNGPRQGEVDALGRAVPAAQNSPPCVPESHCTIGAPRKR